MHPADIIIRSPDAAADVTMTHLWRLVIRYDTIAEFNVGSKAAYTA